MKNAGYIIAKQDELPDYYKGCYVYKHILVAEQMLRRRLKKGECVHHKDLNKKNNNPDNLIVFASMSDHVLYHNGASIYLDGDVWKANPINRSFKRICIICGRAFTVKDKKEDKTRKYCSYACAHKSFSRLYDLNCEDEIKFITELLYANNGNFSKVAKMLNISGNAIYNRLKRKGLPCHSKDYRSINAPLAQSARAPDL